MQGEEEDSSLFRVEPAVQQVFDDLTDSSLNRVDVFEAGQEEGCGRELGGAMKILDNGALAVVIVTKLLIAKGRRSALRSVLLCVLA